MAIIPIIESGLTFNMEKNRLYRPEDEAFYKKLSSKHPIKICDLIYLQPDEELLIIEVKSSAPKKLENYIDSIKQKFNDSILIYTASWANRANTRPHSFPDLLQSSDALKRKMRLVLIVKNYKNEWCLPLKDALSKICTPLEKAFSLEATQVFNQSLARTKLGLDITE